MNSSLFEAIYGLAHRSATLDQVIIFGATWLPVIVGGLVVIIILSLASRDRIPRRAAFIILVPTIAWFIAHILKAIINSPRPALALDAVKPLFLADGNAFPSGHTTLFFALTFALYPFHPKLSTLTAISAILISLARVAAGVHWPIDILGGFILAGVVVFIAWTMVKIYFPTFSGRQTV